MKENHEANGLIGRTGYRASGSAQNLPFSLLPFPPYDGSDQPKASEGDREFDTGARRSKDADATRYDLITPIGLRAVAETYAEGAAKYGAHNWLRGMPVHDLLNHALRHIFMFLSGDRSEPHLPHAAWGLLAAIHSNEMWPELNAPHLLGEGCAITPEVRAAQEAFDRAKEASRG